MVTTSHSLLTQLWPGWRGLSTLILLFPLPFLSLSKHLTWELIGILCKETLSLRFSSFFSPPPTCTVLLRQLCPKPLSPPSPPSPPPSPPSPSPSTRFLQMLVISAPVSSERLPEYHKWPINAPVTSSLYCRAFLLFYFGYCTFFEHHQSPLSHISHPKMGSSPQIVQQGRAQFEERKVKQKDLIKLIGNSPDPYLSVLAW